MKVLEKNWQLWDDWGAYCNGALYFCLFFGASCRVRTTDRCVSRDSVLPIEERANLNRAQRIICGGLSENKQTGNF